MCLCDYDGLIIEYWIGLSGCLDVRVEGSLMRNKIGVNMMFLVAVNCKFLGGYGEELMATEKGKGLKGGWLRGYFTIAQY